MRGYMSGPLGVVQIVMPGAPQGLPALYGTVAMWQACESGDG